MMRIQEESNDAKYQIKRVTPEGIWVNDQLLTRPFVLLPDALMHPWDGDIRDLLTQEIHILLISTGAVSGLPDPELLALFGQKRIAVEWMNELSAARTYSVLTSEGRKVGAVFG